MAQIREIRPRHAENDGAKALDSRRCVRRKYSSDP